MTGRRAVFKGLPAIPSVNQLALSGAARFARRSRT